MKFIFSISRVKLWNIFGHKNPADGTFGYFFQLWAPFGSKTKLLLWTEVIFSPNMFNQPHPHFFHKTFHTIPGLP